MLEIKKITKKYITEGFSQTALNKVSVNFRECEFASILGPSGSGKTTFLNIIGGLDHYDSGDLVINEISTKEYKDADWDSYRNHRIGFVFQSYNLISHQSVLNNVKLALTLSGISKNESTERAKKALIQVGLKDHMYKRPNQLSGGQMQRVAIARALVNDPDILLADEPTGALDSETSIQIMNILKDISKKKLVIMVTHNPELAKEYSSRIINIKDGRIISDSDPYDGKVDTTESENEAKKRGKKTKMSFFTALGLSFNNLMTKKGRTILVSIAGSIGIIGIALILAVSTGFQNYVDTIQEDTLTSYPLTIQKESVDFTSMLLGMNGSEEDKDTKEKKDNKVYENQLVSNTLNNIKSNDLKSFKKYLEDNKDKYKSDVSNISYMYSVEPNIYTYDVTNTLSKINPSSLFSSIYSSNVLSAVGSMNSVFSPMLDDQKLLDSQYDVLAGSWPKEYNEMVIVLPSRNSISDLLVYTLGLRKNSELTEMVNAIFRGEAVNINNEPLELTYDDLMGVDLRLILPYELYKYNTKYDVYEDMSGDIDYLKSVYEKSLKLKISGVVTLKEGSNSGALNPGVAYKSGLIEHIITTSRKSDIVSKQLGNKDIDIFSGNSFDDKDNTSAFTFSDLVSIDEKALQEAFDIKIDQNAIAKQSEKYINNINGAITTDTSNALLEYNNALFNVLKGFKSSLNVDEYLNSSEVNKEVESLVDSYHLPRETYITIYKPFLEGILSAYNAAKEKVPEEMWEMYKDTAYDSIVDGIMASAEVNAAATEMSKVMTETKMRVTILENVTKMMESTTGAFANAFNIDQSKIISAFKLNFSEDELMRVVSAMSSEKSTPESNLLKLGYQDIEEPSFISIYFSSFEGKERFLKFIDDYNESVSEDKKINYTDATGILTNSVKTIVNAVSYVLIAFVSISLVVSSIMIGIITYISVFERTKEIGILRAIGASKRNVSSIFNAETFIIGLLSGLFGVGISYLLIIPINAFLRYFTGNVHLKAALNINSAIILVVLSIILTLIGGIIPAKAASKKDPVIALRTE